MTTPERRARAQATAVTAGRHRSGPSLTRRTNDDGRETGVVVILGVGTSPPMMMQLVHGFPPSRISPARSALATFVAFVTVGFVPLAPFVIDALPAASVTPAFGWSAALAGTAFFGVGVAKGMVVAQSWWRSGLETLVVGGAAATLAYAVGAGLGGLA